MTDTLLRANLRRLNDRLSATVDRGEVMLRCWLIEWPNMWSARESEKPGLADGRLIWQSVDWEWVDWMTNEIVTNPNGAHEQIFGSDGKLLTQPVPVPNDDDAAGEPFRALHVSAKYEGRDRLRPIFDNRVKPAFLDAGNLLMSVPSDMLPVPMSSATMKEVEPLQKWLYFVFDLAWAELPGSPLRPSIGKTCWYTDADIEEYDPPHSIPEPVCWYSVIDDVVQASLHALDLLLTVKEGGARLQPGGAAIMPLAADVEEGDGESTAGATPQAAYKPKRGRPVEMLTIRRADFVKPLREKGEPYSRIFAAYAKKYPRDIDASEDVLRRAFERQCPELSAKLKEGKATD